MKLRFRLRVYDYEGYMGGVRFDGTIDLHPKLLSHPMVLISVVLHELTHWLFDAIGLHGKIHDWCDLIYSYIGLYDYNVNRANLRKMIKSPEYRRLVQENQRRRSHK